MPELSMNSVIILVLAVIVLTAVSVFLTGEVFSFESGIEDIEEGHGIGGGGSGGSGSGGTPDGGNGGNGNGDSGENGGDGTTTTPLTLGVVDEEGLTEYVLIGEEQTFVVQGDETIYSVTVVSADDSQAEIELDGNGHVLSAEEVVEFDLTDPEDDINDISIEYHRTDAGEAELTLKALPGRTFPHDYPVLCNYNSHDCSEDPAEKPSTTNIDFLPPLFAEVEYDGKYFTKDEYGQNFETIDYDSVPTQEAESSTVYLDLNSGSMYVFRAMFDNNEEDLVGLHLRTDAIHFSLQGLDRVKSWRMPDVFGDKYYFSEIFFIKQDNSFKPQYYRKCVYTSPGYDIICKDILDYVSQGYSNIPPGSHTLYLDMESVDEINTEALSIRVS